MVSPEFIKVCTRLSPFELEITRSKMLKSINTSRVSNNHMISVWQHGVDFINTYLANYPILPTLNS